MVSVFSPDRWLSSMISAMEDEIRDQVNLFLGINDSENAVAIAWTHFASESPTSEAVIIDNLDKMLVHFNIDDIRNSALGFGSGEVDAEIVEPGVDPGTIIQKYGRLHEINFDVGVVITDAGGGSSGRFAAYEMLDKLFGGSPSRERFKANTGGIEIISFTAGRFAKDTINDIRVFRIVGAELVVRVYSRDVASEVTVLVDDILQDPDVEIGGSPIVDD